MSGKLNIKESKPKIAGKF